MIAILDYYKDDVIKKHSRDEGVFFYYIFTYCFHQDRMPFQHPEGQV